MIMHKTWYIVLLTFIMLTFQCGAFMPSMLVGSRLRIARAGFISDQSIKNVRESAKISEVAKLHKLKLKKTGSSMTCVCPFHDDTRPSMTIDDEKNLFHCFSCGSGGDIFKFVGELEGVGFARSVEILADMFKVPLELVSGQSPVRKNMKIQQEAIEEAAHWFASKLLDPDAGGVRRYLSDRGLSSTNVQTWGLGCSPPGITEYLLSLNYSTAVLESIGILGIHTQTGGYYERFQHRLMIPIRNLQGKVVAFGGRQMFVEEDSPFPKYINSKESNLFEKRKLLFGADQAKSHTRSTKCCVIVEGYFDVISLHSAGIRNAVACMGTALSKEQLTSAGRMSNGGRVVLALDGDAAGINAAMRACETLLTSAEQLDVYIVSMPLDCKDAHDVVTRHSAGGFHDMVNEALPWTDWYVHAVVKQFPGNDAASFSRRVDKLSDIISQLPSPHMRTFNAFRFAQILAKDLGSVSHERQLELDLLAEAAKKRQRNPTISPVRVSKAKTEKKADDPEGDFVGYF